MPKNKKVDKLSESVRLCSTGFHRQVIRHHFCLQRLYGSETLKVIYIYIFYFIMITAWVYKRLMKSAGYVCREICVILFLFLFGWGTSSSDKKGKTASRHSSANFGKRIIGKGYWHWNKAKILFFFISFETCQEAWNTKPTKVVFKCGQLAAVQIIYRESTLEASDEDSRKDQALKSIRPGLIDPTEWCSEGVGAGDGSDTADKDFLRLKLRGYERCEVKT
jgi:hypothetical protein